MRYPLTMVLSCLVALAPAHALEIEVARSPDVDYSDYRSFGFKARKGIPEGHPLGEEGQMFRQVREAASETLLARGMTLIEGDTPDLWVTFFGLTEDELTIEGESRELGGVTWIGDPGAHATRTELHLTLIVEIFDAASGKRVWSGWATGDARNPEKIRRRAAKVARKILLEFPRE